MEFPAIASKLFLAILCESASSNSARCRRIVAHTNDQNFAEALARVIGVLPTGEKLGRFTVPSGQSCQHNFNRQHPSLQAISSSRKAVTYVVDQKRILTKRISSSSREKIVSAKGNRGTAVAAASSAMSSSAKGAMRISRTTE
jgi:hypothetical protein